MKTPPSKPALKFVIASLLALSAQSFLLVPHRQEVLLKNIPLSYTLVCSLFFLITSYLNWAAIFYSVSQKREKIVSVLSFFSLSVLIYLYAQAALFVETTLLISFSVAYLWSIWGKQQEKNYFEYAIIAVNIVIAIGIFFWRSSLYPRDVQVKILFSLLFLVPTLIRFFSETHIFSKLPIFPWIGWIAFSFLNGFELSILILSIFITASFLTLGLLPFNKLHLPEKRMLGSRVFSILFFIHSVLVLSFFFILHDGISSNSYKNDVAFMFSLLAGIFMLHNAIKLHVIIHILTTSISSNDLKIEEEQTAFEKFINRILTPSKELLSRSAWQAQKIKKLSGQLIEEKENAKRFSVLKKLHLELNEHLDHPVAAQLVVNTTQAHFSAELVAISLYDTEKRELAILASAGERKSKIPAGYRQSIKKGIMGRAIRRRKIQVVNDTSQDQDYINLQEKGVLSEIALPLIHHGHLKGVFMVSKEEKNAFSVEDIHTLEAVVRELLKTWEQSEYNHRLRGLIKSSISLSSLLKTQSVIEEVALIAQKTLDARVVFTALFDQDGSFTRTAFVGDAPNLHAFLSRDLATNPLLKIALEAKKTFRVRDVRQYESVPIDHNKFRGIIVIPIRLRGDSVGAILGFGKKKGVSFSEKDESLADLLATQTAVATANAWLVQKLRATTKTTDALYQLSLKILQTDDIEEAARLISETSQSLAKALRAGIILFSPEQKVEVTLEVTTKGTKISETIPFSIIRQTLITGESITMSGGKSVAYIYLPIQTSIRKYGVLWIEFPESERQVSSQMQTLQTLANQAVIAFERVMLLLDLRQKTIELENSYHETLSAFMSALDVRDKETEGHSQRVSETSLLISNAFNLSKDEQISLERGSLLHDIGKIGISDIILNKKSNLTNEEWEIMRQHPSIGKGMLEKIPFLEKALPVVYAHHERWDGSGYPLGLRGEEIPLEARIFAVSDIFDALTSVRPYREKATPQEALNYLKEQAGVLVDPKVVAAFEELVNAGKTP